MTLANLSRIVSVLPVASTLSRALGYSKNTLAMRIKRGGPELSEAESQALRTLLSGAGLLVVEGYAWPVHNDTPDDADTVQVTAFQRGREVWVERGDAMPPEAVHSAEPYATREAR